MMRLVLFDFGMKFNLISHFDKIVMVHIQIKGGKISKKYENGC